MAEEQQPPPKASAEEMLDMLISGIIADPGASEAWFKAINAPPSGGKIGEIIRASFDLNLPKEITYKIVRTVVYEHDLHSSAESQAFLVEGIYAERAKWRENTRRRRAGLPPLP